MSLPNKPQTPGSWGPPPLTTRPEGLLDSLGIQSGGRYPQHLNPDLQPTYELGAWYREYNQTFRSQTVAPGLTPAGSYVDTGIVVPDGEIWIVNRLGCAVSWGIASNNVQGTMQLVRRNAAGSTILTVSTPQLFWLSNVATIPTQVMVLGLDYAPLIMRPSVKLSWVFNSHAATASSTPMPASLSITTAVGVTICKI